MPLLSYLYVDRQRHCVGSLRGVSNLWIVPHIGGLLMPKAEIFFITPELQQVLDAVPEQNDPRSRLEPFRPYILRWRRQGKSYRKILRILRHKCHLKVAYGTLHEFVKLRSRPRKPQPNIDLEPASTQPVTTSSAAVLPEARKPRITVEEREAARAALRASFETPLFPEERKPLFERRPGPIRNLNNEALGEKGNGCSTDTNSGGISKTGKNE
jgi:hypothetical protein